MSSGSCTNENTKRRDGGYFLPFPGKKTNFCDIDILKMIEMHIFSWKDVFLRLSI